MAKNNKSYERELRKLVLSRLDEENKDIIIWLEPQIRATAANMALIDKVHEELTQERSLSNSVVGSTGQQKTEVNPLLAQYDKMQRTLIMQYESLGLNFNLAPKKMQDTNSSKKDDPLVSLFQQRYKK